MMTLSGRSLCLSGGTKQLNKIRKENAAISFVCKLTRVCWTRNKHSHEQQATISTQNYSKKSNKSFNFVTKQTITMGYGQEMDGCGKFIKFSMFVVNFIIFIGGFIVLGLGIWTIVDKAFVTELLGTNLFLGAAYILVATGLCVCLVSFLGCVGASREVRCMLLTYFIIILVIFVTMLLGGILSYVFRERVEVTMRQEMLSSLRLYGNRKEVTEAWDATQERLMCCGVNSADDWKNTIPVSCCREPVPGKRQPCQDFNTKGTRHEIGCLNVTKQYVREHAAVIGGAGIVVACFMLFGLFCSCALFKMIK